MRYRDAIAADFERDSTHVPFIEEPAVDGIRGRAWAQGFMQGTRLAPSGWTELWETQTGGALLAVPLVAGEVSPPWPPTPLPAEKVDRLLKEMIRGAGWVYGYFAPRRRDRV